MPEAEEQRFRALYESTRPQIIAYVIRRTASREDAADVVADTFEIAWRKLENVPASPDDLLWLYVTARNVLANSGRRRHRIDELTSRLAEGLRPIDLAEGPVDEEGIFALSCLRSLPEEDRELLMLTAWEGLSSSDAGRVLGCSPTAARIRLHRARTRLNAELTRATSARKQTDLGGHERVGGCSVNQPAPEEVVEQ